MNNHSRLRTAIVAFILALIPLGLSNCGETITSTDSGVDPPVDTIVSITYFPNFRNVTWVYEIYDSLSSMAIDTIDIIIKGEKVLSNGELARAWETFHRVIDTTDSTFDQTDSSFVLVAGDSVQFYGKNTSTLNTDLFLFPLSIGKLWENPGVFTRDSGGVQALDSVSVPAGDFPVAARVLNGWQSDFQPHNNLTTSWVVDSVGIVLQQELREIVTSVDTTVTSNKVWRLLSSNLVVPPPG